MKSSHLTTTRVLIVVTLIAAAYGAMMTWPEGGMSHITTTNTVLFDREIVAILESRCLSCHSGRNLAAPLETYEETWLARNDVLREVLGRHMPPWSGVPGYGHFANDNSLTIREKQFLVSWVEGLGPRNDGSVFLNVGPGQARDEVSADVDLSQWSLGNPDVEVVIPSVPVDRGSAPRTARLVFDPGFDGDLAMKSIEFQPADRSSLREATFRLEATGQWLGSWTPWHPFVDLPDDDELLIRGRSRIVAEFFFGAGEATEVSGRLGFRRPTSSGTNLLSDLVLDLVRDATPSDRAAPDGMRMVAEAAVNEGFRLLALVPQLAPRTRSLEVSVRRPDGGTDVVLYARDIRTEWPTPFLLDQPLNVPTGSRIRVVTWTDTVAQNTRVTVRRADATDARP